MNTYYTVFTKKTYLIEDQEKTSWYKVGYIKISASKGSFLVLHQQPETTLHLFESTENKDHNH